MNRTTVNFLLDTALLVAFLALVWVTFVLRFVFPPPTAADGWRLWGWSYDDLAGVQFAFIGALLLGLLVHVMLHWTWVCGVIAQRWSKATGKTVRLEDGHRTLYGVGLIVVLCNLLGGLLAAAWLCIQGPGA